MILYTYDSFLFDVFLEEKEAFIATKRKQRADSVSIEKVLISPEKYKDRVLVSSVFLTGSAVQMGVGFVVNFKPSLTSEYDLWLLAPKDTTDKADRIRSARGQYEQSTIKYWCSGEMDNILPRGWILLDVE